MFVFYICAGDIVMPSLQNDLQLLAKTEVKKINFDTFYIS